MKEFTIARNDVDKRTDKFLSKLMPNLPEPLIYKYIRKKRIKINGKKVLPSYKLKKDDVVTLYVNDEFFEKPDYHEDFKKAPTTLSIVYEDSNILLVNKKTGLIVHPDENFQTDCLINRIKNYLFRKGEYISEQENSFSPSLVNRIDRNTGGIVIAAKNSEALMILNKKMKSREITKKYICIISSGLKEKSGVLTGFLEKDSSSNTVYIKKTQPKNSETKAIATQYSILAQKKNFSLAEVTLLTGRTHQIRAHMASEGCPILGDGKYGKNAVNRAYGYKYQALYSYKLKFDFKTDAGSLNYLKGKEFKINDDEIWFIKDFYENL